MDAGAVAVAEDGAGDLREAEAVVDGGEAQGVGLAVGDAEELLQLDPVEHEEALVVGQLAHVHALVLEHEQPAVRGEAGGDVVHEARPLGGRDLVSEGLE